MPILKENVKKILMISFINESNARNKYSFFAYLAIKEGFENIAKIFLKIADQEKEHAKFFFNILNNQGNIKLEKNFEIFNYGNTLQNLKNSYDEEFVESNEWYPDCAKITYEEGYDNITTGFINIANAENYHAELLKSLINKIENNTLLKSAQKKKMWRCESCGCHFLGATAPNLCPLCNKAEDFFSKIEDF